MQEYAICRMPQAPFVPTFTPIEIQARVRFGQQRVRFFQEEVRNVALFRRNQDGRGESGTREVGKTMKTTQLAFAPIYTFASITTTHDAHDESSGLTEQGGSHG